ncbi:hypothetical protein ACFDR9_004741 [Janthinobacterium sp. CG_23.3]|uniref:FxDxF family PEP-CTERM protein n=1 Tax=Janthinobacterium sp. CG_23.3 TaxID=3349634 RepID=UPI0038D3BF55
MKIKALLLAAMLAVSTGSALAANYAVNLTQTTTNHWSAAFASTPVTGNGGFADTFTFSPAVPNSTASSYFFNFALDGMGQFNPNFLIMFTGADLNGNPFTLFNTPPFTQASVYIPNVAGQLVMNVSGVSNGGSYSGILNVVTAVPEPATYGMMLGGLALVGFMARRRKQA